MEHCDSVLSVRLAHDLICAQIHQSKAHFGPSFPFFHVNFSPGFLLITPELFKMAKVCGVYHFGFRFRSISVNPYSEAEFHTHIYWSLQTWGTFTAFQRSFSISLVRRKRSFRNKIRKWGTSKALTKEIALR